MSDKKLALLSKVVEEEWGKERKWAETRAAQRERIKKRMQRGERGGGGGGNGKKEKKENFEYFPKKNMKT